MFNNKDNRGVAMMEKHLRLELEHWKAEQYKAREADDDLFEQCINAFVENYVGNISARQNSGKKVDYQGLPTGMNIGNDMSVEVKVCDNGEGVLKLLADYGLVEQDYGHIMPHHIGTVHGAGFRERWILLPRQLSCYFAA